MANKKTEKQDKLLQPVTITLYADNMEFKDDAVVIVNGKTWLIERGVPVQVPKYVALAIGNSVEQRMRVRKFMGGKA